MTLSIIIVNTSEWRVLNPCLASVFEQTRGIDFEVIVVDNASTDGSRELIAVRYPDVLVVANSANLGFAAANNRGFALATGRYVLMLNPDTVVTNGALNRLVEFMDRHPQAGIAACRLRFPDGTLQRTASSFPGIWNLFTEATFLGTIFPKSKLFGRYHLSYLDYDAPVQVDWLVGALLMIRREVISAIGLLDEQFYMYTEETDYCYRAKQEGFEVWFTPCGDVLHFWGGMNAINRRIAVWVQRSQVLFYQKHFHGFRYVVMMLLKYVSLLLRIIVYAVAGVVRADRYQLDKSRFTAFALRTMLVSGWKYQPGSNGPVPAWETYR